MPIGAPLQLSLGAPPNRWRTSEPPSCRALGSSIPPRSTTRQAGLWGRATAGQASSTELKAAIGGLEHAVNTLEEALAQLRAETDNLQSFQTMVHPGWVQVLTAGRWRAGSTARTTRVAGPSASCSGWAGPAAGSQVLADVHELRDNRPDSERVNDQVDHVLREFERRK